VKKQAPPINKIKILPLWVLPVNKSDVGSAMNNTLRQIGGALGVAVLGTAMNNTYLTKLNAALAGNSKVGLPTQDLGTIRSGIQAATIVAERLGNTVFAKNVIDVTNHAFVAGMKDALIISAIITAVASLVTLIILPSRIRTADYEKKPDKDKS
jgi:hypothetical protein